MSFLKPYTDEFSKSIYLAFPVIMGLLGHTFVGFVDNIMVGRLGTAELAAVSLGNSFVFLGMAVSIGFSRGLTPLIAEADASNKTDEITKTLRNGFWLCAVIGSMLASLSFAIAPLMYVMNQPKEVVVLALPFLAVVSISLIPMTMFQALKQFTDGLSYTKYGMYANLLGNIVNIILNAILIFGLIGFPKMGIMGAAYATLFSRILMMLYMVVIILWGRFKAYKVAFKLMIEKRMIYTIVRMGVPSSMQMFFEVLLFISAIWISGVLGKNAQAANQIALNLTSMTYMITTGFSVVASIRVANQKGLGNFKKLRIVGFSLLLLAIILDIIFLGLFLGLNDVLPTIYLDENDPVNRIDNLKVIAYASELLIVSAFFQFFDGVQVILIGALRGIQDMKVPTWITFFSYSIVGFGVSYYLGLSTYLNVTGVWVGLLSGLVCASIFLFFRFNKLSKRLIINNGFT